MQITVNITHVVACLVDAREKAYAVSYWLIFRITVVYRKYCEFRVQEGNIPFQALRLSL